jgi:hypothetical protein
MINEKLGTLDGEHLQVLARQTGVPELVNSGPCPDLRDGKHGIHHGLAFHARTARFTG